MTTSDSRGRFIGYLVVAALTALTMFISASGKLTLNPGAVHVIHDVVRVPLSLFPLLAACEIAGGFGLLAGMFWTRLGIVAGASLVLYFVGAMVGHLLVGDWAGLKAPIVPFLLSATALLLRASTTRRLGAARRRAGRPVPG